MTWIPILALAAIVFLVAAFALKLPRSGWTLFGAALMFGLTGYALQGSPDLPAAPKERVPEANESNSAMIEARRDLFGRNQPPANLVVTADAFSRSGRFSDAAKLLRGAIERNPRDAEAWVALGNALVEHADGNPTPAAMFAYSRADQAAPGHPAPAYFYGVSMLNANQPQQTRAIWAEILENAPEDAPWRETMQGQLDRLDEMLSQGAM